MKFERIEQIALLLARLIEFAEFSASSDEELERARELRRLPEMLERLVIDDPGLFARLARRMSRRHYLREWREFRCLSQAGLAQLAPGILASDIEAFETGKRHMRIHTQLSLMAALGIQLPQFFAAPPP